MSCIILSRCVAMTTNCLASGSVSLVGCPLPLNEKERSFSFPFRSFHGKGKTFNWDELFKCLAVWGIFHFGCVISRGRHVETKFTIILNHNLLKEQSAGPHVAIKVAKRWSATLNNYIVFFYCHFVRFTSTHGCHIYYFNQGFRRVAWLHRLVSPRAACVSSCLSAARCSRPAAVGRSNWNPPPIFRRTAG